MADKANPFAGDSALVRARKIALAYRAHLNLVAPARCAVLDETLRSYGETWLLGSLVTYDDTDAVTTKEAAALVSAQVSTIRRWACTPDPTNPQQMLLPRFRRQGRDMTYLVEHVRRAAQIMEHGKVNRATRSLTT